MMTKTRNQKQQEYNSVLIGELSSISLLREKCSSVVYGPYIYISRAHIIMRVSLLYVYFYAQ